MGIVSNLKGVRAGTTPENLPISNGMSTLQKKKCSNWMPLFVGLVVIAEITFLGRLDMINKTDMVGSFADWFYRSSELFSIDEDLGMELLASEQDNRTHTVYGSCEEWLEKEDHVTYSRDFMKEPIHIIGGVEEFKTCSVGCMIGFDDGKIADAVFGRTQRSVPGILRSMESSQYYPQNNVHMARRRGFRIVMTTSLSSDVPVGYFSWSEYDIMAPVQPKTESALAAAFISNCAAENIRLKVLEELLKLNVKIDSYGGCHRNRDGNVNKVQTLKHYKFSLAFENSNEEDYVTEKYFQSLVAGSVPVVVGAPNIEDFSPGPGAILHISDLSDVKSIAKMMTYLSENPEAYNQSLRWKFEGPSDSFKALVDMAVVHSSCRLCIHLATIYREKEERTPAFTKRPCKCTRGHKTVYHLYVRERGRFDMESVFLRSNDLTLESFHSAVRAKFQSLNHTPIWKEDRPESIRGGNELKIYRVYPVGVTQRQALYTFRFKDDSDFITHLENHPCAKFEVIFV